MTDTPEIRRDRYIRMINRHMARLLHNLEEAGCPKVFVAEVKNKMQYLRKDFNDELAREKELVFPHDHW